MRHYLFLTVLFAASALHAEDLTFPKNFEWCVATAGHQVEGDNIHSDWWEWEKLPGKIKNNDRSGKASYHIERLEEDVQIMANMGAKTYRFSIEWSRIEPRQGEFDPAAFEHYRRELRLLKQKGIGAMVTLHHFVQPQWFTASGGWRRPDSPEIFLNYVKRVYAEFGKDVTYWVTFNEPTVLLIGGYIQGVTPPGESGWDIWDPMINIMKSHALAYRYMHSEAAAKGHPLKIGLAHHLRPLQGGGFLERKLVPFFDYMLNWNIPLALHTGEVQGFKPKSFLGIKIPWFTKIVVDEFKNTQDFMGLNYYTREYIRVGYVPPALYRDPYPHVKEASELNWGVDPEGFYEILKISHQLFPQVPFYITENGLADKNDQWRGNYIISHLQQLHRAMTEFPHQIDGYCHWSLLDNFEWIEGFEPRFGLFEVDYQNGGARKARDSARLLEKIFKSNKVPNILNVTGTATPKVGG